MQRGAVLLVLGLILFAPACKKSRPEVPASLPATPLPMEALKEALSHARGEAEEERGWPREVRYTHKVHDFRTDTFQEEERVFAIQKRPLRIVPHAVGVAEILWAICPRDRLIAFNDLSADPALCVVAGEIEKMDRIFNSKQTELILAYEPDLVFTVFYSGPAFKKKLERAGIATFDLGHFGTIESIREQILLIGSIIGEEGNAEALVELIDEKARELEAAIPRDRSGVRVLYYDEGGYVPGRSSNFNSICELIRVVNVGAEQGVKTWSQIDYETLLKWDPEIILVPEGSGLKKELQSNALLIHAEAVRKGKVFAVPGIYLRVASQYLILSANVLAGIVYAGGL
jgi:iron complex transport system substrate-binding protein